MALKKEKEESSDYSQTRESSELLYIPMEELFSLLSTKGSGLTSQEVEDRYRIYGYNEIEKRKKRIAILEFLSHFSSPLVLVLLVAGLISGFFGQINNTIVIFTCIILSIGLDFYQDTKAEKATKMLIEKVSTTATVFRDNIKQEVKLYEIVPGDIIDLSAGDIIPADSRIINERDLFINQSVLTGESYPVEKVDSSLLAKDIPITEWKNCLFMGTSVVSGTATAVVLKTGMFTEYGKIAKKLIARTTETEFEKGIKKFSFLILEIVILLVIFVFAVNALYPRGTYSSTAWVLQSLLFAVALAVGLTPELLPMIITLNLSKGALAMAKKDVIVKRLASIQNFGSMDVLCTDKTGTLTENKVTLILHIDLERKDNEKVLLYSFINSNFQTGLRSPLDEAILSHKEIDIECYQKVDEIPFDFIRKRVSVVVECQGREILISKGAPEEIEKVCSQIELNDEISDLSPQIRNKIIQKYEDLSSEGFRVLGVSYKEIEKKSGFAIKDEMEMVFLGFVAFIDPPKETARESLQLLQSAGIEVKILTGDNELVTRKTCEYLDFKIKGVILGPEMPQMQDDALARAVEGANVFARVTPVQKDGIVRALKINGHVVGFLGDGINDAPSLKISDIGISVDNAVDVAKESADIILLQKRLRVIYEGVLEGRKTFGNSMKYIMMGISSNFGNMLSCAGASLFLPFLPMLPIQILLNNLLYDISESTIPTDNVDQEYIQKPKKLEIHFIRNATIFLGPISSIFDFLTFFVMLFVFNAWLNAPLFQTGWFVESLSTQALIIFAIRTRKTPFFKSKPSKPLIISTLIVVGFVQIIPFTPLSTIFGFVPLPWQFYLILAGMIVAYVIFVEIVKKWFYKRFSDVHTA